MKLCEVKKASPNEDQIKQIREILKQIRIRSYGTCSIKVRDDLKVDIKQPSTGGNAAIKAGIMFNHCDGNFIIDASDMCGPDVSPEQAMRQLPRTITGEFRLIAPTTLKNGPVSVGGNYNVLGGSVASLDGVALNIGGDLAAVSVASLSGVHKAYRNLVVGGTVIVGTTTTNIVGLAAIPGVNRVGVSTGTSIIKFDVSHHDMHKFQDQLLDAGFEEQARL